MRFVRKLSFLFFIGTSTLSSKDEPKLPRNACMRSSTVNLHVGPGLQYPVDWILTLKHMPVVVISEFGQWRRIKLCDGTVGWVHRSLLSSKKTAMLLRESLMFASTSESSKKIARLEKDVVVAVVKQKDKWTKVVVTTPDGDKFTGWVVTRGLWGV
ncbi:MAG: hypothetical protein LBQ43_04335 [Holosporales bacterium]|jgi:SH3-like domain-containing protein|nr:hypothetical protein [Holosporales bacterium]